MKMPKKILVYTCDFDNGGNDTLVIAHSVEEIPADLYINVVGEYKLVTQGELVVKRELVMKRKLKPL